MAASLISAINDYNTGPGVVPWLTLSGLGKVGM
jgi:hypothetical protein